MSYLKPGDVRRVDDGDVTLRIVVERGRNGQYYASWETAGRNDAVFRNQEAGRGQYSTTIVGALAELCALLSEMEDDGVEWLAPSVP